MRALASMHTLAAEMLSVWMVSGEVYVSGGKLPSEVRRKKSTEENGGRLPDTPASQLKTGHT